jgi:hypothetical protein
MAIHIDLQESRGNWRGHHCIGNSIHEASGRLSDVMLHMWRLQRTLASTSKVRFTSLFSIAEASWAICFQGTY